MKKSKDAQTIKTINFCVLIPTYNNDKTLENVITETMKYTKNIIVVNDGSTDNTGNILKHYKTKIEIISYPNNQGKGAALRKGFKKAEELGYEYAITLDSDGQHYPSDIPNFLKEVTPGQNILIIGNRDMTDESIPQKSIFGRKFSNFWVTLETNLDLKDSQSGYRLYTVAQMNRFHYFTVRYDFELESLVWWVWNDYPVKIVPIGVYYPPAEERVSHFKGFKDNFRISVLNTVLVTITFSYIIPRRFFRMIIKGIKNLFKR